MSRGWSVGAVSRTPDHSDRFAPIYSGLESPVRHFSADLADERAVRDLADQASEWCAGQLDLLIHVAGIGFHCPVENLKSEELTEAMMVNAIAPMLLTSSLLPVLRSRPFSPRGVRLVGAWFKAHAFDVWRMLPRRQLSSVSLEAFVSKRRRMDCPCRS